MDFEKVKKSLKDADPKEMGKALGLGAALCAKWIKQTAESKPVKESAEAFNQMVDKVKEGFISGWMSEEQSQGQKTSSTKASGSSQSQDEHREQMKESNTVTQESGIHRPKVVRKKPVVKKVVEKVVEKKKAVAEKKQSQSQIVSDSKSGIKRVVKKVQTDDSSKEPAAAPVKRSRAKMG